MGRPINQWSGVYGSRSKEHKQYVGKVSNYFSKIKVAEIKITSYGIKKKDEIYIQGITTGVIRQDVPDIHIDNIDSNKNSNNNGNNKSNNNSNNKSNNNKSNIIVKEAKKGQIISIKVNKLVRKNDEVYKIIKK